MELQPNKNTGVFEPILKPTDYVAGKESKVVLKEIKADADWNNQLPTDEAQFVNFETGGCTNFTETNLLEAHGDESLKQGEYSQKAVKFLQDGGYFDANGKLNFSDRFLYKMSGTTVKGNQVENGWDAIHRFGLIPEKLWPMTKTYEEFIKPVPKELQDFGKQFLTMFDVYYEWIVTGNCGKPDYDLLEKHLKQSPLQIIHPVGTRDLQTRVLQNPHVCVSQHSTMLTKIDRSKSLLNNFDSYYPYRNELEGDYPLIWVMKGVLVEKVTTLPPIISPFAHFFYQDMKFGQRSSEVLWLQKGLNRLGYDIPINDPNTGYYGEYTRAAVLDFQKKFKVDWIWNLIALNGKVVGPKTRNQLNILLK